MKKGFLYFICFFFVLFVGSKVHAEGFIVDKKYQKYFHQEDVVVLDKGSILVNKSDKTYKVIKRKKIPFSVDKKLKIDSDDYKLSVYPFVDHTRAVVWGNVLSSKGITGEGIKVGVIDTGVSKDNACLNVKFGINTSLTGDLLNYHDTDGHGTHVAGLIASRCDQMKGVAPDVDLYVFKVDGDDGVIWVSSVIMAIDYAIRLGVDVINISLSVTERDYNLEMKIKEAQSKGIIIVASMGNLSMDKPVYPAGYDKVISVGSVNDEGKLSYFSNRGSHIDFVMFGENIKSLYLDDSSYMKLSGTSMATPLVTGLVALVKSKGYSTYDEIYQKLIDMCVDLEERGFDNKTGYGIPILTFKLSDEYVFTNTKSIGYFYDIDKLLYFYKNGYYPCISKEVINNTLYAYHLVKDRYSYELGWLYYYLFKSMGKDK